MKRSLILVVTALGLIVGAIFTPAVAANHWSGCQILMTVEGTKPISAATAWSGTLCRFEVPKNSTVMWFAYTGPTFTPNAWLWVSPQVGYAGGWSEGQDTFVSAGWATITLPNGIGTVDLDGEVFATAGHNDTYWYNQYNRSLGAVNYGLHWESVNDYHQWGPQLGVRQGPWKGKSGTSRGRKHTRFVSR